MDLILAKYTEKRSQQLLNDNSLFVAKEAKKTDLGTKAVCFPSVMAADSMAVVLGTARTEEGIAGQGECDTG